MLVNSSVTVNYSPRDGWCSRTRHIRYHCQCVRPIANDVDTHNWQLEHAGLTCHWCHIGLFPHLDNIDVM